MSNDSLQNEELAAEESTVAAETTTATVDATGIAETTTTEQLIYVGPNISSERLNRFAIFKNGLPQHMDDVLTACPAIKKLFINIDKLSAVLDKINKTGTAYNSWYSQVQTYLKKGVK
ncbi:MAG: hypothetical protein H6Q73_3458 [Firmicutes bacterium]|nr:hypothetical protein [Bacillota bacterium]